MFAEPQQSSRNIHASVLTRWDRLELVPRPGVSLFDPFSTQWRAVYHCPKYWKPQLIRGPHVLQGLQQHLSHPQAI